MPLMKCLCQKLNSSYHLADIRLVYQPKLTLLDSFFFFNSAERLVRHILRPLYASFQFLVKWEGSFPFPLLFQSFITLYQDRRAFPWLMLNSMKTRVELRPWCTYSLTDSRLQKSTSPVWRWSRDDLFIPPVLLCMAFILPKIQLNMISSAAQCWVWFGQSFPRVSCIHQYHFCLPKKDNIF